MLSPRQSAQLGLGAACLILVSSVAVLVGGASDQNGAEKNEAAVSLSAVSSQPVNVSVEQSQASGDSVRH